MQLISLRSDFAISDTLHSFAAVTEHIKQALAATDDLDGLILCHAEPMCFIGQGLEPLVKEDLEKLRLREPGFSTLYDTPLYRAWEPK